MQPEYITPAIAWPAVVKLFGDHELLWLPDSSAFHDLFSLSQMRLQTKDILIDRDGQIFTCGSTTNEPLTATSTVMSLDEVIQLVRLHLEQQGHCCVSKFYATTIAEAFSVAFNPVCLP